MSIRIIKAGMLDTIQDHGRFGFQYIGINPGGVMDNYSAFVGNSLVGNNPGEALVEMHFPAATILFQHETIIAVSGADFTPVINGEKIPLLHPVIIAKNSVLQFQRKVNGARCYLSIKDGLNIQAWLNSYSTNLKANAGGYEGRQLKKDDLIFFKRAELTKYLDGKDFIVLSWKADMEWNRTPDNEILVLKGNEWDHLSEDAKGVFGSELFSITISSDRMGYRLSGPSLQTIKKGELLSSAVSFGTIQLLPDGQLIVLMSDHQTTGGYPRLGHVISSHLPKLAQMNPGDKIKFSITNQKTAEDLLIKQHHHLQHLHNACTFKLSAFLPL